MGKVIPAIILLLVLLLCLVGRGESLPGKILFVSIREERFDLFVVNPDGSGLLNLTNDKEVEVDPAWSPDGSRIAYITKGMSAIQIINADGTGRIDLADNLRGARSLSWSPDGTRLVFTAEEGKGEDIHVISADGSGLTNLTKGQGRILNPMWPTGGKTIYYNAFFFGSMLTRKNGIYTISPDGMEPRRIMAGILVALSPDGQWLIYSLSQNPGGTFNPDAGTIYQAYLHKADGSGRSKLIDTAKTIGFKAAWSPDGSLLAYVKDHELYLVNGDGSGKKVKLGAANDLSWAPDGTAIVYSRGHIILMRMSDRTTTVISDGFKHYRPVWSPR